MTTRWTYPRGINPPGGQHWLRISPAYSRGRFTVARRIRLNRISDNPVSHALMMGIGS